MSDAETLKAILHRARQANNPWGDWESEHAGDQAYLNAMDPEVIILLLERVIPIVEEDEMLEKAYREMKNTLYPAGGVEEQR